MSVIMIFILVLSGIILIETLVIVIMGFILKNKKQNKINYDNQQILNIERMRKIMEKRKKEYNEKISKATNHNDYIDIINDIMSKQTDSDH